MKTVNRVRAGAPAPYVEFFGDEPVASDPAAHTAPLAESRESRIADWLYMGLISTGLCFFIFAVSFSAGFLFARLYS